jgi:hypothetical protein
MEEPQPPQPPPPPPPQPQPQPPPVYPWGRNTTGLPVDIFGAPAIDPTKNVETLVKSGEAFQAVVRAADQRFLDAQLHSYERFQNFAREAESNLQKFARQLDVRYTDSIRSADQALAAAETRRIDQLAQTRQEFQNTIRDMLAASATSTSTLVATQLVQIQTVFDTRVSKLEAYQFTQAGKSSVQDPQLEGSMRVMAQSIASLTRETADAMTKLTKETAESATKNAGVTAEALAKLTMTLSTMQVSEGMVGGRRTGQMDTNARLLAIVMAVAAVASPVIAILVTIMAIRGHG